MSEEQRETETTERKMVEETEQREVSQPVEDGDQESESTTSDD